MDGVTILNTTYEYAENFSIGWCFLGIFLFATLLGSFLALGDIYGIIGNIIHGGLVFFTLVTTICLWGCYDETDKIVSTIYQVTIDESVSVVEFNEKYEIIEQNGLIYTVKERKANDCQ